MRSVFEGPVAQRDERLALALENAVCELPGVVGAAVRMDEAGHFDTLTTVLAPDADEAAVATRLDGVLRSSFGIRLDSTRISVVEESGPQPGWDHGTGDATRVAFVSFRLTADVLEVTAEVTLAVGTSTFSGTGTAGTDAQPQVATASAVLGALRRRFASIRSLQPRVRSVTQVAIDGERVALVLLSVRDDVLVGTATIAENTGQAVVRATLDALNRSLESTP